MAVRSPRALWRAVALLGALALVFTACGDDDDAGADDEDAVESVVRASVDAENAKDADAFLELWTDKGLESYDVGSRTDLEAGKVEDFGSDRIELVRFSDTKVTGSTASTQVDAVVGEADVAKAVFRVVFTLIEKDGDWLVDGFEFKGSPPPAADATVVDVKAQEYAFVLDRTEAPGDVAFKFSNVGKEPHELTFYRAPDGVELAAAKAALENVDGSELEDLPAGYAADHLSFAEPGQSMDVTFAEDLASGTYVLACYLPEGGFGDEESGPKPDARTHIQLGMIALLTVG